ncbi:uncharacterized protein [Drosophila pseudoobscura]|uniref:Uncharacterized protein n=1 Tax=Drosophila pseudoobscura pseudoobscura TaxID=46245 RepID=A0A6I8UMN3_DROPS|nr:uncharacterized protein LOC4800704 [Drosophila pseudoobscura]
MPPKQTIAELQRLYDERWIYPPKLKPPKIKIIACGRDPSYGGKKPVYKPCWENPLSVTNDARFGPCWEYPPERYKRRPLPPPCRGATIPLDILEPTFDHCKTLYTIYDFRLEQCVHEQILLLETQFKELEKQLVGAKVLQIKMAETMRYHAMRYRLLVGESCCTNIYPEYLSRMTAERALCEFQKAYNVINQSNDQLSKSLLSIRQSRKELEVRLSKLDRTLQSPFLLKLDHVLQTIDDINQYFFGVAVKLLTWAELMDPNKEYSIEDYLALLSKKRDFKSFLRAGTEHCTCKRCNKKDPLTPHCPSWCRKEDSSEDCVKRRTNNYLCNIGIAAKLTRSDSKFSTESSDTSRLVKMSQKVE